MNQTIGFIGCGNMGSRLVRAAARAVSGENVLVCDADEEKAGKIAGETGAACADIRTLSETAGMIFLGVKPQMMEDVLLSIRESLKARKDRFVLVTMAAGLPIEKIRVYAGLFCPVIRIMPNLAVSKGEGMILYTVCETTEEEEAGFLSSMKGAGKLLKMPENLIDAGSAVSGCGPAYVCLFIEALADASVKLGIPRREALLLSEQTVLGTAAMLLSDGNHPAELKDAVCSPGGTTIAGVMSLERDGFRAAVENAVEAAYRRTLELK